MLATINVGHSGGILVLCIGLYMFPQIFNRNVYNALGTIDLCTAPFK